MRGESKPVSPETAQPARATVPHSCATLRANRFALIRTAVATVIAAPRTGDPVITSQFCTCMIYPRSWRERRMIPDGLVTVAEQMVQDAQSARLTTIGAILLCHCGQSGSYQSATCCSKLFCVHQSGLRFSEAGALVRPATRAKGYLLRAFAGKPTSAQCVMR